MKTPRSVEKLANEFGKLPGIGQKTASRLTFYLLKKSDVDVAGLADAVAGLKAGVRFCSICHNMAEDDPCATCTDTTRDRSVICVVEEPLDAQALDATGGYKGLYHVLGGALSPLDGIGPEQLNIESLVGRVQGDQVREVILATNASLEGETTASHVAGRLKPLGVKITRLGRGLPVGGDLEYADEITITRALEGRSEF